MNKYPGNSPLNTGNKSTSVISKARKKTGKNPKTKTPDPKPETKNSSENPETKRYYDKTRKKVKYIPGCTIL